MWKTVLSAVLVIGLMSVAVAEEETPAKEPQRGFKDGKFLDEYFGIAYVAEGLKEGFSFGATNALWSGKCAGGVDVELICEEGPRKMKALEWRDMLEKSMTRNGDTRKDVEKGDKPVPWMLYVQESVAGFQRHHGYALYVRGFQCFLVHAKVREKSDVSAEAIHKALAGLKVDAESDSLLQVHYAAKNLGMGVTDPKVLLGAGIAYMRSTPPRSELSLRALLLARAGDKEFDDDERWTLYQGIGLNQLLLGEHEVAVETWKRVVELAAKTSEQASYTTNSLYNLTCAYSLLGRLDEAFATLGKCFEAGPAEQVTQLKTHAGQDPDLENMRKDERWKALLEKAAPSDESGDADPELD